MKYTALFRGINVGGKNIVKMNDLKELLLGLELKDVRTYLQSGNAVFESSLDEAPLREKIQAGFLSRFGFESCVIIRSLEEMRQLTANLPFTAEEITKAEAADPLVEHLYVYFLNDPPEKSKLDLLSGGLEGPDKVVAGPRELYLLTHQSIRKSKLAIRMAKTFDTATVRNWKSVSNLYEMLTDLN